MAPALDEVVQRFAEQSPVAVMARAALGHALDPQAINALLERASQRHSTRALLFPSVVGLMAAVVARGRPAVNAAYRARAETLCVSLEAAYAKLDPGVAAV
ncbi:hypothetical protein [Tautonia plasticadhaerens]|uniref:Uncharacterized protein n=1 Tax=Tautonia plasticadhaerens TaxID=2527974 RepID=A0A518HFT9_9BACT|nr:hypothetical protein [Tautonia plasticadhaerens]QDV39723.1 hypothetical protein ElP_76960 [Tautonia plasticadhaerens]